MKEYMELVSVEEAIKAGHKDTLCWDCEKAMRGGCCWTDHKKQEPVKGWVATGDEEGYHVYACPEFRRETYGGGRYRTADDYILALEIAVTDKNRQIANLKKTMWWKYVNKLRCEKRELQVRFKALCEKRKSLEDELDKELWHTTVHMSE